MTPDQQKFHSRNRFRQFRPRPRPRGATETARTNPRQAPLSQGGKKLRIIVLGGLEEVGRNMTLLEYGNDILIIDMGLQFPEEDMPGVDYVIPNISYLKGKERNVRGVIITHGHYDHIGAIPYLAPALGNPPIFAGALTIGIIKKREEDFQNGKLNLHVIQRSTKLRLGVFRVEFTGLSHTIPDSLGVIVHTPEGIIFHTGDFKIDPKPEADLPPEIDKLRRLSGRVLALLADSTNASLTGRQLTETQIKQDIETIIRTAPGRLIVGTFASNLGRIQQLIWLAERYGRRVFLDGRSMKTNVEIARQLGYMKIQKQTMQPLEQVHQYPDSKIMLIVTGAQGEGRAALVRIANREHRFVKIQKGDLILFSSSVIPGNERTVQRLTDTLYREGAEVINYQMMDVHAGGHAKQEDLLEFHKLIRPRYLIPIEGQHAFLHHHAKVGVRAGIPRDRIFVADNGQVIEFQGGRGRLTNERVKTDYVFVDGLGVGDVSHVVIRDRQQMSADGMFVIIVTADGKTGRLIGEPDILSRGFVHMRESQKLIADAKQKITKILRDREPKSSLNDLEMRNKIRDQIGSFLFTRTERRPLILPVVIEV